jgi:hypothetical protein
MDYSFMTALIPVAAGLLGSLVTLAFTHWSRGREDRLKRKQELYDRLFRPYIAIFQELLAEKHNIQPLTQRKVGEIAELSFLLPMYVPDQLFRAFQQVQNKANKLRSTPESEQLKVLLEYYLALGNLVLEVRKDLGYRRTSLKGIDIMRNVIHDIDDHAKKYGL